MKRRPASADHIVQAELATQRSLGFDPLHLRFAEMTHIYRTGLAGPVRTRRRSGMSADTLARGDPNRDTPGRRSATLELSNSAQVAMIDEVEVGRRVARRMPVAFEVDDTADTAGLLAEARAEVVAPPTRAPWESVNARLEAPAELPVESAPAGLSASEPRPPLASPRCVTHPARGPRMGSSSTAGSGPARSRVHGCLPRGSCRPVRRAVWSCRCHTSPPDMTMEG